VNAPLRAAAAAATLGLALLLGACSTTTSTTTSDAGTAAGSPAASAAVSAQHLDAAAFADLAAAPGTVLLDVRTPEEFAAGHLEGARNVNFQAADFDARLGELDHATSYAVYCHSGNRSGQALEKMAAAGFTHVADLAGGITAWADAGRAITTS